MDGENIEPEDFPQSSGDVPLDNSLDDQPREVPFKGLVSERPFNLEQKSRGDTLISCFCL